MTINNPYIQPLFNAPTWPGTLLNVEALRGVTYPTLDEFQSDRKAADK